MNPKIMVVDDSPTVREIVKSILMQAAFEVFTESDSTKAVQSIKDVSPDLVILDIMMPEMDGYTLLRHIRKERELETLPVIMLSAKSEEGMKDLFSFEGISGYLEKPFKDEDLINLVKETLAGRKGL